MSILNAEFWIFVLVVAGIYAVFSLGLQLQFGYGGLLNFGQVGFRPRRDLHHRDPGGAPWV